MVDKRLQDLLAFAETTDLQELVWEKKGACISFRRSVVPDVKSAPVAQAPAATPASDAPAAPAPETLTIKSNMVGTFYRADSASRPPLVVEGTVVTAGQPVAAIEAMKIMKDVLAPNGCRIVKALVANGHPVEYGQPLFEIEPDGEANAHV